MKYLFILLGFFACCAFSRCSSIPENAPRPAIPADSLQIFVQKNILLPSADNKNQLAQIIQRAQKDSLSFRQTIDFLILPFSDPNSMYRNEELYIQLLHAQIQSPFYIAAEKQAATNKLHLAMQNRVGARANNFTFITPEGKQKSIYTIDATYMLLYFYNPECHACQEMQTMIHSSKLINEHIYSGKVKLLAMYIDADEELWRRHLPENPKLWISGRDEGEYLWKNKVYDLRAIPTMYLLDSNKIVLLKDATVEQIEHALRP